jgi:AcrR family transcriptional regulator
MGRPARIGRDAILDAALALADKEGLDAVSMHAVARRLGVSAMALYRHMDGKDALLDGLVERLLTSFSPPPSDGPWDQRLNVMAADMREVARRHPAVFPLLLTRPAVTPAAQQVRNSVRGALREAGLTEVVAARAERLLSTAVFGFAASEATGRFRLHSQAVVDEDFAELLRWLALGVALARLPTRDSPGLDGGQTDSS